jgi:hypothetical protein
MIQRGIDGFVFLGMCCALYLLTALSSTAGQKPALPIIPGAYGGFGMKTPAGSGRHAGPARSRIIKVTTLEPYGPGSLFEAVRAEGPRTVVFEIGGVIDYRPYKGIVINSDYLTVAGGTAPGKGIAIYGAQVIVSASHVHIDNVRFRVGDLFDTESGFWYPGTENHRTGRWTQFSERDSLKVKGDDIVFSNCSFSWATDELVNTKGSRLSFYRCLFAEPIASPKHHKGLHPKAMIIQSFADDQGKDVAVIQNAFLNTDGRNPLLNPRTRAYVADNYIGHSKFGIEVCHGRPDKEKFGEDDTGGVHVTIERIVAEGVWKGPLRLILGAPAPRSIYLGEVMFDGKLYANPWDDLNIDRVRTRWGGKGTVDYGKYRSAEKPVTITNYRGLDIQKVRETVLKNAGAFSANRGPVDTRIIANVGRELDLPNSVDGTIHPKEMEILKDHEDFVEMIRNNTVEGGWVKLPVVVRKLEIPEDPFALTESGYTRLEEWLHTYPQNGTTADTE